MIERRDQPAGGEIVVDIGPDAHGDAESVGGGLQRLAVILQFRSARGDARDAGAFQPARPIVRRMRDAEQAGAPEIGRAFELRGELWRAHRQKIGGEQRLGDEVRPFAVAERDAAAPVVGEGRGHAAGGDTHLDVGF